MGTRRRVVGRDDENSGSWEWEKPLTDYHNVLEICAECEEAGIGFPMKALVEHMRPHGAMLRRTAEREESSTGPLLESLLEPYFSVDVARFDADMPGFSGSAAIAVLTLGHTREVRRRLRIASAFLAAWSDASGLTAATDATSGRRAEEWREGELQKERERAAFVARGEERKRAAANAVMLWEAQLRDDVRGAMEAKGQDPYCRLNFLVHEGVVFFLQRGWWHGLHGDVHAVASKLEAEGVPLVRLAVTYTRFGHVPTFARSHPEEPCVGWGEHSLEVAPPAQEFVTALAKARAALRR